MDEFDEFGSPVTLQALQKSKSRYDREKEEEEDEEEEQKEIDDRAKDIK